MAPAVEISIPNTTLQTPSSGKPYTLYNITLRLPLRTFVTQKRYSDFEALDKSLRALSSTPPPEPLPGKSWFKSTATSPALTEERRKGLETYLKAINESANRQWRDTSIWRSFLNLPSSTAALNSSRDQAHASITGVNGDVLASDESVWLDVHREMKAQLHDARLHLGKRDAAQSAKAQFEAGANAKRCLVKAGTLLQSLEDGLKGMAAKGKGEDKSGGIGEGELRRRKDLLSSARVEKEGLEQLAVALNTKFQTSRQEVAAASTADKGALFGPNVSRPGGRVLGAPVPETDKTRELDNEGVLMLQKQMMQNQDLDVEELAKIVRRQKEMGLAINEELVVQNEMLSRLDEDVDRVQGKMNVAKKRLGKIK